MQAESLELLEKADVVPAQARAIVRAIEIEIAGAKDTLATKHDLVLLRQDLRGEMADLRGEMAEFRSELRGEMAEVRSEISALRVELKGDMVALEARLEVKIHECTSNILRQMYTAMLGQMAVLLGFAYFFTTHMR